MRISSDSSSWKASGVIRRDVRASHDGPEVPRPPRAAKDTRRWCRGIPGREHRLVRSVWYYTTRLLVQPDGTFTRSRQPAWHYRCEGCGTTHSWRLPLDVRAAADPRLARCLALADRWCRDGHLYDQLADPTSYRPDKTVKACVMCGWRGARHAPVHVQPPAGL
jgi:hypothetical protein